MSAAANQEEEPAPDGLDVHDLHIALGLLRDFEDKLRDNRNAREKHPDDPARFMDSELALHAETDRLRLLAGAPELFPNLIRVGLVESLSSLLTHDNPDMLAAAASLLADFTNSNGTSDLAGVQALADELLDASALDRLVHNICRLSEPETNPEEAEAVHHSLAVLENLIDLRPWLANVLCDNTKLLNWLLARVKSSDFEANKQYAAEILSLILLDLESNPAGEKQFAQMNGVNELLQAVVMYKSRDPTSTEEKEMMKNILDCLCFVLMSMENKERFVKADGVELMVSIMKPRRSTYSSAIRTLDVAMTRYPPACERFIDVLGLKPAFAAFMASLL